MSSMDYFYKELKELYSSYKSIIPPHNIEAQMLLNRLGEILEGRESISLENPLTKRENEVLSYVSKGFTNREIASALSISAKTIEYHLKNIYQKTETSGRSEAISFAISKGWIKG